MLYFYDISRVSPAAKLLFQSYNPPRRGADWSRHSAAVKDMIPGHLVNKSEASEVRLWKMTGAESRQESCLSLISTYSAETWKNEISLFVVAGKLWCWKICCEFRLKACKKTLSQKIRNHSVVK